MTMHSPTTNAPLDVPIGRLTHSVAPRLIVRIEGQGNYTFIHTSDGRKYMLAKPIGVLASRFPRFWRLHKSHLVNPDYVAGIGSPPGVIWLRSGEGIPVARRRKKSVTRLLRDYTTPPPQLGSALRPD